MPTYTKAHVTCYCGREHIVTPSKPIRCACGAELHVQQKRGGGKAWGRVKDAKTYKYRSGKIGAQWIE